MSAPGRLTWWCPKTVRVRPAASWSCPTSCTTKGFGTCPHPTPEPKAAPHHQLVRSRPTRQWLRGSRRSPLTSGALLGALTKTNARLIKTNKNPRTMGEPGHSGACDLCRKGVGPGVAIPSSRWDQAEASYQGKRPPWSQGLGPVPGRAGLVPRGLVPGVLPGQGRVGGLPGEPVPGTTTVTPKGIRQRATPCVNTKKAPSRQHGGRGPSFVPLGPSPRARGATGSDSNTRPPDPE